MSNTMLFYSLLDMTVVVLCFLDLKNIWLVLVNYVNMSPKTTNNTAMLPKFLLSSPVKENYNCITVTLCSMLLKCQTYFLMTLLYNNKY